MASNPLPLLRMTQLFAACAMEDLEEIASFSGFCNYEDGEAVFAAGDASDSLFIVHGGEVVIRRDDDEGHAQDIARFLPGDCFGELDLFLGSSRNASAYADGRVSLLSFPSRGTDRRDLEEMKAATRAGLLHSFMVQVSSRTRAVNSLVKENSPEVQELKRQVYVDKLTGLNNRTCFDEVLETTIAGNDQVGLLLYKPDNFKAINDRHGHDAGDKVLRLIAERLRDFVDDEDALFRFMGNENAVILPGGGPPALKALAERLQMLLNSLSLEPALGEDSIRLSASFGLAIYPHHAHDARTLTNAAHPLTLEGRRRGGNMILFPEDSEQ